MGGASEGRGVVMNLDLYALFRGIDPLCLREIPNGVAAAGCRGSGTRVLSWGQCDMGMRKESIWYQGKSTRLALLCCLICPIT